MNSLDTHMAMVVDVKDKSITPMMPIKQSGSPILAPNKAQVSGRAIYVWKHGKTMFLSAREHLIAEEFLTSRSYASCVRKLKSEMGYELSPMTVMRWLRKGHIQEWLQEQLEERGVTAGWTKEHWLMVMTKHIQGKERLKNGDLYAMALIGKMKGWETKEAPTLINEINIVQANGRS